VELAQLLDRTGLTVLDHLELQVAIPVIDGLQAQGDLIVIPRALVPVVTEDSWARWSPVPRAGVELIRGANGANPHTLTADPGTCEWTPGVRDPLGLAVGLIRNTAPVHLVHPEHGGIGIAPGEWVVRRQQERGTARFRSTATLVCD